MNFQTYLLIAFIFIVIGAGLFFLFQEENSEVEVYSSEKTDTKEQYYWEPTACTPVRNPVEIADVSYIFKNGASIKVFDIFLDFGMGKAFCGVDYGKDWKNSLPSAFGAKWISYAEKKAYVAYDELPFEQLTKAFNDGYDSFDRQGNYKKEKYETLSLCLLPDGEVVLYLIGSKRTILLDWVAKGEPSIDYEIFRQEGDCSTSLNDHIKSTIKLNPELRVSQTVTLDRIHKYFERFNYSIKIEFEDMNSSIMKTSYEFANSERSISLKSDVDNSIKNPSRIKYFKIYWKDESNTYEAHFYFNEDEVLQMFDDAFGENRESTGVFNIWVSKHNNLFDISLTVNEKKYSFKKTEIHVFRENELIYMNYKGKHKNVFKCE